MRLKWLSMRVLADPAARGALPDGGIGFVGADLPIDLLLATGRVTSDICPGVRTVPRPWLISGWNAAFPGWSRSMLEDWHAGASTASSRSCSRAADDASQRLYYYVRELQRAAQLRGPRPLIFDIAMIAPRVEPRPHRRGGARAGAGARCR